MNDLTASQWAEVEKVAREYQRTWGLSFPAISVTELRQIIRKSRRSNAQNATLWGVVYPQILRAGGETLGGWTDQDLHEYLLGEWSGWDRCTAFGRTRLKPKRRSSRLTKSEFGDYLEFICRRMAEHGIVIEMPGDMQ